MTANNNKQSFTMWMTTEEHTALRAEAEANGLTMTQVLRIWIRATLLKRSIVMPAKQ